MPCGQRGCSLYHPDARKLKAAVVMYVSSKWLPEAITLQHASKPNLALMSSSHRYSKQNLEYLKVQRALKRRDASNAYITC